MTKKKNKIYWLAGIMLLCCMGGVFAYWTQELQVHNEFKTARYDTTIEEKFVPPDNWKPGEEINKDVWIANKGTVPVFAKVVLHQEWVRKEDVKDLDGSVIPPAAGEKFPLFFETKEGSEYAAQIAWGKNVALLESGKKSNINLGVPTVGQIEDARGKWLLVSDVPDQNGDYLLYYIGMIEESGQSPLIVDSVTMNPLIQPSVVQKDTIYDKAKEEWVTTSKRNSTYDYECSKYTMLVTGTTVQATSDAVKEIFGTDNDNPEVVNYLANHAVNPADL